MRASDRRLAGVARKQRGYVLLFVVSALALMSFGVGRYAARVDLLRDQVKQLRGEAQARLAASNAMSRSLYWLSTRPVGFASSGFVDERPLNLDGRTYETPDGALVEVLDDRATLSVNAADSTLMATALMSLGVPVDEANRMVAILQDYVDEDDLRRLNGAEKAEYAALGISEPPANSWITDVRELRRLPLWRDKPDVLSKLEPWLGLRPEVYVNPNTAPLGLLKLLWPRIESAQWASFDSLRRQQPFGSSLAARAATGIPFDDDHYVFHAMATLKLKVWAEGLPQSLEYNLSLLPEGPRAPWVIHSVVRGAPLVKNAVAATPIEKLPIPSTPTARSDSVPPVAP